MSLLRRLLAAAVVLAAACAAPPAPRALRVVRPATTASPAPTTGPSRPAASHAPGTPRPSPGLVEVRYRVDVRVPDGDGFASFLAETMAHPHGWRRAGFVVVEDPAAPYVVVIAEGDQTHALCLPYDVGGQFSCQNGPLVAINAQRWRHGVPHWTGGLESYRRMLLNHEMGHLLGQRHRPCPGPGRVAPVMFQQSGGLGGCTPNAWPLDGEIERAARHDLKLAPAYGE